VPAPREAASRPPPRTAPAATTSRAPRLAARALSPSLVSPRAAPLVPRDLPGAPAVVGAPAAATAGEQGQAAEDKARREAEAKARADARAKRDLVRAAEAEARSSQLSGAGGAAAAAGAAAAGPPASRGRGAAEKTKYVIPVGARVRVGDNSRSPVLRGLSGVVISFDGRHVEVKFARATSHRSAARAGHATPRHATPPRLARGAARRAGCPC
jgi:hypothetical protein